MICGLGGELLCVGFKVCDCKLSPFTWFKAVRRVALILLDFLVHEEDVQTPTTSKVPYIPISHCGNGAARWAPSSGLQTMVCLPRQQSTHFSPCHCQCSNPSPTTLTTHTERRVTPLSWPEVGKDELRVKAAGAGKDGVGGGGNGFFTIIETKGGNLSVMMDQKYEDVKRSYKKKPKPGCSQWWPLRGQEEYQETFVTVKMTKLWHRLSRRGCGVSILDTDLGKQLEMALLKQMGWSR